MTLVQRKKMERIIILSLFLGITNTGFAQTTSSTGINGNFAHIYDDDLKISVNNGYYGIQALDSNIDLTMQNMEIDNKGNRRNSKFNGIYADGLSVININGTNLQMNINNTDNSTGIEAEEGSIIKIDVKKSNNVNIKGIRQNTSGGIEVRDKASVSLKAGNSNMINADFVGISADEQSQVDLIAGNDNIIAANNAIVSWTNGRINLTALNGSNVLNGIYFGISGYDNSDITLNAPSGRNIINVTDGAGILADNTKIRLKAENNSIISQKGIAVDATVGSSVNIIGRQNNYIDGLIYVKDKGTVVNIGNFFGAGNVKDSGNNYIIINIDGNNTNDIDMNNSNAVSAIYAGDGAVINIGADERHGNYIMRTLNDRQKQSRLVWVSEGSVNIQGRSDLYATDDWSVNSKQIALAAGTVNPNEEKQKALLNLNFGSGSKIIGDITAGKNGYINITPQNGADINMQSNILAANGGSINIDTGDNSFLTGRIDDYSDAAVNLSHGGEMFKPEYSDKIISGGNINLTLGKNSQWNVAGQSWVSQLNLKENSIVNLVSANMDERNTPHALLIENLSGNGNFVMSLKDNRNLSDMLYLKKVTGVYNIVLTNVLTNQELGKTGLRFATVGAGSNIIFKNVVAYDKGAYDVKYVINTDKYLNNAENNDYNNDENHADGSFGQYRPGNEAVGNFLESGGQNDSEILDYKIFAVENRELSNVGNTILNMSKANYSQAVYMDRLSKRMGESHYINGNEGLWVRMRYDETDKDKAFKISTNMYEIGYDRKSDSKDKNGYHRRGIALDYMDGNTSYDDIAGSGETNRKGIWFYDTWFGNKGHYTDYVVKWGHLENSFDLYTRMHNEKVNGEYDNDVYSVSGEWGYKNKLNGGWYIEPQLQMQYAHVTGENYKTTQETEVSADGIDSLIARAGFRFGRDFGKDGKSTFYVKADILHEFFGEQNITVRDKSTEYLKRSIDYDNGGTWYTIGLGLSTELTDHSYAFLDIEKTFGSDNNNSYQINGGMQWAL